MFTLKLVLETQKAKLIVLEKLALIHSYELGRYRYTVARPTKIIIIK